MNQDMNESTRVMPSGGAPDDRTMVAGAAPPAAGATQMGVTVTCPVCRTTNTGLETYCGECGFVLASTPGAVEEAPEEAAGPELVEATGGRRFRLKPGANTVGRENCDILLMDGTVSRRHAQVTLENGAVSVTDAGSTNGTQVDGVRLSPNEPTPVAPGSTLRFGNATLTLAAPGGAEATIVSAGAEVDAAAAAGGAPAVEAAEAAEAAPAPAADASAAPSAPESAEPAVARLKPTGGAGPEIALRPGTTTIGRRPGNSVVVTGDPYISGRHAEITCDNTGCYLTDLGSTNGSQVNGQKLEPNQKQLLLEGDEVSMGQTSYAFETLEAPPESLELEPAPAEGDEAAPEIPDSGDATS